ncbi:MAG: hypothetical protein K0R61_4631 [Microvirga sp.]|jgi:hypothetical protein|nr:hypothetical protein [Microvirga sp.]
MAYWNRFDRAFGNAPGVVDHLPEVLAPELSRKSEHEIHEAVIACTRARHQMISQQRTPTPTVH